MFAKILTEKELSAVLGGKRPVTDQRLRRAEIDEEGKILVIDFEAFRPGCC